MRNALISVSNKANLTTLANFLFSKNVNIYSTGGTYNMISNTTEKYLQSNRLFKVSDLTQFPEILNGRVKTLHPTIYGSILARHNNISDMETLKKLHPKGS